MNILPVSRNLRDNHIDIHLANWRNHQNCHRLTHHGHSWLDTHRRRLHIQPQSSLVYTRIQVNRAYPHHLPVVSESKKRIKKACIKVKWIIPNKKNRLKTTEQNHLMTLCLANPLGRTRVIEYGTWIQIFTDNFIFFLNTMLTNWACARRTYISRISRC